MSGSILGQEPALRTIVRAMQRGRMHHAWIFHGPTGVGKFSVAMQMARLLLDPETTNASIDRFDPPRGSAVAQLIDAGTHPDLHVIRKELAAASAQRELRDRKQTNLPLELLRERMLGGGERSSGAPPVYRTSMLGHGKVFIIDEAELLETEAQNAMLKTLEEPPERTWIILCTRQEDRLLPTIRSRCQCVSFGPLGPQAMEAWWTSSGLAPSQSDRAWIDGFAAGSPGLARVAVEQDLPSAWRDFAESLESMEKGRFDPALADRMAEFIDSYAKRVVKENEQASKEAANRAGATLLLMMLGSFLRRRLRDATTREPGAAEPWIELGERLRTVDDELRANLNLKHVVAHLVADWARQVRPVGARR